VAKLKSAKQDFSRSNKSTYDIICIGAGSGGLNVAGFMNKAGFNVLLIDKSDKHIGGDCLNFGCIPSKTLIEASKLVASAKEAQKYGIKITGKVNLKKVSDHINKKKEQIREHENAAHFQKKGIDVVLGLAKFTGKNSITVNGKEYTAKKIILATGAQNRKMKVEGIEKVKIQTNETIFNLTKLPKHLLIIGAGPIGIELGQAFNNLGCKVTIIEHGDQFLKREDPDIAAVLHKQIDQEKIKIHFSCDPVEFPTSKSVIFKNNKTGKSQKMNFDEILISIGRVPTIDGLDIEKAGIERQKDNKGKLVVDDYLRTTNKDVIVCGDVAGSYQFTHAAEMHAAVIIHNLFTPRMLPFLKKKINYDHIAWVTYTHPEIATFGVNQSQLRERKISYELFDYDFEHDDRAITSDSTYGRSKVYVGTKGKQKGKILGGTMIADAAGELIQELILAKKANLDIKHIFGKVYPYPTASRVNKYTIRPWFARKLNERTKRIFKWLY